MGTVQEPPTCTTCLKSTCSTPTICTAVPPTICNAVPCWLLNIGQRETPQYTSICTAIRLLYVPQYTSHLYRRYFWEMPGVEGSGKFLTLCASHILDFRMQLSCLLLEASCLQLSSFTYSCAWELFCLQFELFYLQFELLCLQLFFFASYSGKVCLRSTSTDCKERSSTVSKKALTVSRKASPVLDRGNWPKKHR